MNNNGKEPTMTTYRIENPTTGVCLGDYQGATAQEALDAMARDAGYADYAEAQTVAPAELTVVAQGL
jgi:hypothetical protein